MLEARSPWAGDDLVSAAVWRTHLPQLPRIRSLEANASGSWASFRVLYTKGCAFLAQLVEPHSWREIPAGKGRPAALPHFEIDPLCQRQLAGPVDGIGLAPHV